MSKSLYYHGGSGNHGCEAIVRATASIIGNDINLFSFSAQQDRKYSIDTIYSIYDIQLAHKYSLKRMFFFVLKKATHKNNNVLLVKDKYKSLINSNSNLAISVGGDNYCYPELIDELIILNQILDTKNIPRVLWGCSIEPELLQNNYVLIDLKGYASITARESITYEALVSAGLKNVYLYPDPAFILKTQSINLPEFFDDGNTVGINISPMIMNNEKNSGISFDNYKELISYILNSTDMSVCLIPHVVWADNDDRRPLISLFDCFNNDKRISMVPDCNCMQLKGYISRCRFFIGARTHSTIAAYSSCVPTLTIGYSVKAKGIAKDIFGTYDNYVLPVQTLREKTDLTNAFKWLYNHEANIRAHLQSFMPGYIEKAWQAGEEIRKLGLICHV